MGMHEYKTELDLNNAQRTLCLKHEGVNRFASNWGLARKQEARAAGKRMPSAYEKNSLYPCLAQDSTA